MHTRTMAAAGLLAAGLLLTGCSSGSGGTDKPTPAATITSAAPTLSHADLIQACVDAVAGVPADDDGSVPSEPRPGPCTGLPEDEYLDAYMDGIQQSNQAGRDGLSTAACRAAIEDQYEPGTAQLTGAPTTPPECADLSEGELSQIVLDVISENTGN
jgi:hypothetical protein